MTFADFNLHPRLIEGLNAMRYESPTPIQQKAIKPILAQHDVLASAQTGTGKTAAYLLPVIQHVLSRQTDYLDTLILVPTRELALQVDQQIEGFGYFTGVSSIPVYGGGSGAIWEQQKRALQSKTDIVVATPGRLIAHIASSDVDFKHLRHIILDEADRMLDMGFYEDIMRIIAHVPAKRQTLLFSATMPSKIKTLAKTILNNPVEIAIAIAKPAEKIRQRAYLVYDNQKVELLTHLLSQGTYSNIIIFTSTKSNVKKLDAVLRRKQVRSKAFHSDLDQSEREHVLREFKSKKLPVLVATDVLSRGIDVEGIDMVINFDVPSDPEDYIHRIGRTARAERDGTAITFVNDVDQKKLYNIERMIDKPIPKVELPANIGKGPLYQPDTDTHRKSYSQKKNKVNIYRKR